MGAYGSSVAAGRPSSARPRLARELSEAQRAAGRPRQGSVAVSPTLFRAYVHPCDFDVLTNTGFLEEQLGRFLEWLAFQRGYITPGTIEVRILRSLRAGPNLPVVETAMRTSEECTVLRLLEPSNEPSNGSRPLARGRGPSQWARSALHRRPIAT